MIPGILAGKTAKLQEFRQGQLMSFGYQKWSRINPNHEIPSLNWCTSRRNHLQVIPVHGSPVVATSGPRSSGDRVGRYLGQRFQLGQRSGIQHQLANEGMVAQGNVAFVFQRARSLQQSHAMLQHVSYGNCSRSRNVGRTNQGTSFKRGGIVTILSQLYYIQYLYLR